MTQSEEVSKNGLEELKQIDPNSITTCAYLHCNGEPTTAHDVAAVGTGFSFTAKVCDAHDRMLSAGNPMALFFYDANIST